MPKAAQFGLKGILAYPVVTNTATTYAVGAGFTVPHAQEHSGEDDTSEATIYADDTVYHKVRDLKGTTFTLTLAELPIELKAELAGGDYDETLKKYTFPVGSTRPTLALRTVIPFVDDSGWNLKYYPVCEVLGVQMAGSSTTRSDNVSINAAQLLLYAKPRLCDNQQVIEYEPVTQAEFDAAEADFITGVGVTP